MSLTNDAIIRRFADFKTTRQKSNNVFIDGDRLHSYRRSWTVAIRKPDGGWGAGIDFLINGDVVSVSTNRHTRLAIDACVPNVQIPFSSLVEAGIRTDLDGNIYDLRILNVRRDTWHDVCSRCGKDSRSLTDVDARTGVYHQHQDGTPICVPVDAPAGYAFVRNQHVLGAVLFEWRGRCFLSSTDEQESWRRRAYFLCELPRPCTDIKDAYIALTPEDVHDARRRGCPVVRQGDIFAIGPMPNEVPVRVARVNIQKSAPLFEGSTHIATEVARNSAFTLARGILRHKPSTRWGTRRPPQHDPRPMGDRKTWHRIVKNTAIGSWSAKGEID